MAFTPINVTVQLALGADLTAAPATWSWTDITRYVRMKDKIVITRGRADEFSEVQATQIKLTLSNVGGRFVRTNPTGPYYGQLALNTPLRVQVDIGAGAVTRATGFVDEWPPRWNPSGDDASQYATVTASGIIRRLEHDTTQRSALYQTITSSTDDLIGYWPCEDVSGSTQLASAVGGPPIAVRGTINYAADSTVPGSDPLPTTGTDTNLTGQVGWAGALNQWGVRWVTKVPAITAGIQALFEWTTGGDATLWRILFTPGPPGSMVLQGLQAGVDTLADPGISFVFGGVEPYGQPLWFEVNVSQSGANIAWNYTLYVGTTGHSQSGTTAAALSIGNPQAVGFGEGWGANQYNGLSIGHIVVTKNTSLVALGAAAATGFTGDTSAARFSRLCATRTDIASTTDLAGTELLNTMGPIQRGTVLQGVQAAGDAEDGLVWEMTDGRLAFRSRFQRQNRAVSLTTTYGRLDASSPPQPSDDDQKIVNDCTVTRTGGSSAHYTAPTTNVMHPGSMGIGTYPTTPSVLLQYDSDLPYRAQWEVHKGTISDLRWPKLTINLRATTTLATQWLTCDIGSRIQLTSPPTGLPPDTIDLLLEGYTETINAYTWTIDANCSPARPWETFTIQDSRLGRIGSDGVTLHAAYNAVVTSMQVDVVGPLISTAADTFDLFIAGERVTVTAVSGSSSPQTLTVTRSVNGVSKAQLINTPVNLWRPGTPAL